MLRKMVSLLPVESLVVMSSKDSGGEKFRERKTLNIWWSTEIDRRIRSGYHWDTIGYGGLRKKCVHEGRYQKSCSPPHGDIFSPAYGYPLSLANTDYVY